MRTLEEINIAVELLRDNRSKTKQFNVFGDDNHAAIDMGINTLLDGYEEEHLYDVLDNEEITQHEFDFAYEVILWREGQQEIDDLLYPV